VLEAIQEYRAGARAAASDAKISKPAEETLRLLNEGRTFEEIARARNRRTQAVVSLIAEMIERGEARFQAGWFSAERFGQIAEACRRLGMDRLKPLKEALAADVTYEEIKLVVAHLRSLGDVAGGENAGL